jgi:hypothetical protein
MSNTPRKFSITLPQKVANALEAIAIDEGRTKANLATFAVELWVRANSPDTFRPKVTLETPPKQSSSQR